ncbi:MAG: hypothetical protein L0Z71_04100 [Anaerolineae bacterium]|nr:hypothetical protein [Anaerolineae bacterium]
MNTHTQTDVWISRTMILLGLIAMGSAVGAIILTIMNQPMPEIIIALGMVALSGLAMLLIPSPLK